MSRVAPDATAFWRRHVPFMASFDAVWDDPADDARSIDWAREVVRVPCARTPTAGST